MKIRILLLILLVGLCTVYSSAQDCKYPKKMRKFAQKHLESENVIKATKFEVTLKNFNNVGITHFAKTDNGYFLGLSMTRDFARKSGVKVENPMVITLENESLVTLYPQIEASDRGSLSFTTPMGTKYLRVYYNVTTDQVELFATTPIKHIKINMTFQKTDKNGNPELDLLEFDIKKEKWRSNFMLSAKCILQ